MKDGKPRKLVTARKHLERNWRGIGEIRFQWIPLDNTDMAGLFGHHDSVICNGNRKRITLERDDLGIFEILLSFSPSEGTVACDTESDRSDGSVGRVPEKQPISRIFLALRSLASHTKNCASKVESSLSKRRGDMSQAFVEIRLGIGGWGVYLDLQQFARCIPCVP
jgi:hypothetical protein